MPTTELDLPYIEDSEGTPEVPWRDAMDRINAGVAGRTAKTVTTANVTLTAAEARAMFLDFSGVMTAARSVIVPALNKVWLVSNNCTGGFDLTVRTAAGSGVIIPAQGKTMVYCDGSNVVDAFSLSRVRVYNDAAISIPNAALTALTFNQERFDVDELHSTSSNTGRITFREQGTYAFGATVEFAASAGGTIRRLAVRRNGTTVIAEIAVPPINAAQCLSVSGLWLMLATDYIEFLVYQDSGGALNVNASSAYSPEAWAHRVL